MEYFSVFVFARSRRGLIVTEHRQRRRDGAEGDRHVGLTGKKKYKSQCPVTFTIDKSQHGVLFSDFDPRQEGAFIGEVCLGLHANGHFARQRCE